MRLEKKYISALKFVVPAMDEKADEEGAAEDLDGDVLLSLKGYASTYEDPSNPDSYGDIFAPGAFDDYIKTFNEDSDPLPLMDNHGEPVGGWNLIVDDPNGERDGKSGLWVEGEIIDAYSGTSLAKLVRRKIIKGLSVGVYIHEYSFDNDHLDKWGYPVRRILKASLAEVSPTPFPANSEAGIREWKSALINNHVEKQAASVDLTASIAALDALLAI